MNLYNYCQSIVNYICIVFLKSKIIQVAFALLILNFNHLAIAGSTDKVEYKVKAAYLYQFTKFTQWPESNFSTIDSPIQICIIGISPFGKLLDKLIGKTSQNREIKIKYISSLKQVLQCHIVFISRSAEEKLKKILALTENTPVLTVSDINGFAMRGGIVGFVLAQSKIKLEINYGASTMAGIKLSSKILEMATLIKSNKVIKE